MKEEKIVAAILATALTDNRWTLADAEDLVRRYGGILKLLESEQSEPPLDPDQAKPDIADELQRSRGKNEVG